MTSTAHHDAPVLRSRIDRGAEQYAANAQSHRDLDFHPVGCQNEVIPLNRCFAERVRLRA
jgi:hypothetical protein